MNLRIIVLLLLLPLSLWVNAAEQRTTIEERLQDYYASIGKKEIRRAIGYYHPKSAKLEGAQAEFEQFTQQFDLSYKITGFEKVGEVDGDVIVVFQEATTFSKVGGDALNTFNAKVLMVWRKDEAGNYRIWDSIPLKFAEAVRKADANGQQSSPSGSGKPSK